MRWTEKGAESILQLRRMWVDAPHTDFANGKCEESYGAKGEVKAGAGFVSAGAEVQINSQLEAKVAGKISGLDTITVQGEKEFK